MGLRNGTHLPVLIKLVSMTNGPILELGGGIYSTPFLHWACFVNKRELVTYENDPQWYSKTLTHYATDFHQIILTKNWDNIPIERPWDIALVDHAPASRRIVDITRLADHAKFVVIHDSEGRLNRTYNYPSIYPLFKHQYHFREIRPHTSVLSNFINFDNFKL